MRQTATHPESVLGGKRTLIERANPPKNDAAQQANEKRLSNDEGCNPDYLNVPPPTKSQEVVRYRREPYRRSDHRHRPATEVCASDNEPVVSFERHSSMMRNPANVCNGSKAATSGRSAYGQNRKLVSACNERTS